VISCGNREDLEKSKKPKPLMRVAQKHSATANVNPLYAADVKDWKELKAIDSFFVKYRNITPNEALSNAVELKDLIKNLIDSVQPKRFRTPSLNARVNILYNEALRLADLTEIAAIKAGAVNRQVAKTMAAFSSVNIKINTVIAKLNFESEIDINVDFIGLDTRRLEVVSKKNVFANSKKLNVNKGFLSTNSVKTPSVLNKGDRNRTFSKKKPILKMRNSDAKLVQKERLLQTNETDNPSIIKEQ
jgi:hypothetical protein